MALGCSVAISELHISFPASASVNSSRLGFILSAHDTAVGRKNGRCCSWKYEVLENRLLQRHFMLLSIQNLQKVPGKRGYAWASCVKIHTQDSASLC